MRKHIELITVGVYVLLFVSILVTIQQLWFKGLFDSSCFLNWDAEHYNYINNNGYKGFRIAFFPLFPLI